MTEKAEKINYSYLANSLDIAGVELGLSEVHGMMTGMICGASRSVLPGILASLEKECAPDLGFDAEIRREMALLQDEAVTALDTMEFDLLLPEEPQSLLERFTSFQHWCRGFLFGLGISGIQEKLLDQADIKEGLSDLMIMAHASDDQIDTAATEENEQALVECREYCRVVVMTIYAQRFSATSEDSGTATVH